jgi:hypothetical protein
MTEKDWLGATDVGALIDWVEDHASVRQFSLLRCSQGRRLGALLTPDLARALDARERAADGHDDPPATVALIDDEAVRTRRRAERAGQEADEAVRTWRAACGDDEPEYPSSPLFTGAEYLRARQAQEEAAAATGAVEAVGAVFLGPVGGASPG